MSALALRIFACFCMLLDHLGYALYPFLPFATVLRCFGRLAFPLFVFLIVNGYRYSSNRLRYALRLALFALLSQIPFSLFCGYGFYSLNFNVFVTLLLALLTVWSTDALLKRKFLRCFAFVPGLLVFLLYYFGLISSDYGMKGIFLALTFRYLDKNKLLTVLGTFCSVFYAQLIAYGVQVLKLLLGKGAAFSLPSDWVLIQGFSLFALIPIFFYNGKRGRFPQKKWAAKAVQWGFYLFYPLHMILLTMLRFCLWRICG